VALVFVARAGKRPFQDRQAEIAHHRIGQGFHGRCIELADDALRPILLGARSPYQAEYESAGGPISAKVAISGANAQRVSAVTAQGLMLLARISASWSGE
jgi:hypothetical protein